MKAKYLVLILCLFTICLVGCKKTKCGKVEKEDILKNIENFDITINVKGEVYRFIKSSQGLYLNIPSKEVTIYQNIVNNIYYEIDDINKTKTVLNAKYNIATYLENIYYVLTYHTNKEKLSKYDKEKTSYLNFDVIKYSNKTSKSNEEFYVDNDSKMCLSFLIENSGKKIECHIEQINLTNTDLSYIEQYKTIKQDKETLQQTLKYYDITVDLSGSNFQYITSSDGIYYNNDKTDISIFYDNENHYSIDNKNKSKIIISDEYDINLHSDELFYLLGYHLDKVLLFDYTKEVGTYLNRDVVKYKLISSTLTEEIYVDKETNACLYFKIKSDKEEIICKVNKIKLVDTDLSYLDEYTTLKKCEELELKDKEEIISNFKTYQVSLIKDDQKLVFKKNEQGLFCSIEIEEGTNAIVYNAKNNVWYDIFLESLEKSLNENENKVETYEDSLFSLLTVHLDAINDNFYKEENLTYLDRTVTKYIRNIVVKGTIYKQEYIIDDETGACLKQIINFNGKITSFSVEKLQFETNIDEYFEYDEIYYSWPKDLEILEGIEEIEYGTFVKGMYDEDGFNLIYTDIKDAFFRQILKDMQSYGFTKEVEQDYSLDSSANYVFFMYSALNDKGLSITLHYTASDKSLIIIFK